MNVDYDSQRPSFIYAKMDEKYPRFFMENFS